MPSVGIPSSNRPGSTRGAPSAYTDAGPPLRINACGLRARTCSGVTAWPTSSEYTRHSRTRRAISCAYCPPRSNTSTGRSSGARSGSGRISAPIVGCLFRNGHVMRMALPQTSRRDAHEPRLLHLVDRRGAAVPHRLAQSADELVKDRRQRSLVRNAPLDALGDELVDILDVALAIPVARGAARAHRTQRAHAAVLLEPLALVEDDFPRRFVGTREDRAGHHRICAGGDCLGDVPRGGEAPVTDQRHSMPIGDLRAVVD